LWDTATGEELKFVDYEGLDVFQVEFSPDGRCFAVASQDSAIRIYDLSGELRQTLNAHIAGVGHIAFSRDGTRLLSASADQTLRIWDVASGSATACLRGHLTPASYVTFIGDESRVLSAAYNEPSMKVWQATTSNEPATFETGKYFVLFVEFTPDGSRIFTHQRSWDSATLEPLASLAPRGEWAWNSWVTADPAFEWVGRKSPDLSGAILRNGVPLGTIDEAMSMRPVVSPDHRLIAIALRAGPVRIWRVSDGALQSTLAVDMPLTGVCFARDGSAIITWANGGRWCIFDALSGREALRGNHGTEQIVNATFSADGRLFATASYDGAARICETATGSLLHVLRPTGAPAGDQSVVWSVAFSPDGTRLATGSKDRRLRLWDVATGAELISLGRHAGTVMCISWSPDGSQIATGGFDGTVCLWDSVSRSDRARSD
ncbi:MAG: WD40 repeat domain-containing protein, partial [Phycisphaerales bacterium]|nr:WD40 repeat domain-containing protein [Phycisphaerales bacterium]